jgi:hypothetical protein
MDDEKSLVKVSNKYNCMVSGKSQMTPCEGCSYPKGCLSSAMQYKENEEMDEMDEKAVVKIDADGGVVKCAKGLGGDECGYKAGAKVCGACGAMAVLQKEEDVDTEEKGAMEPAEAVSDDNSDEVNEILKARQALEEERRMESLGAKSEDESVDEKAAMKPMVAEVDGEDEDMEEAVPEEDEEEEDAPKGGIVMKPRKGSRRMAMEAMGVKSEDVEDPNAVFLCASDRKVYPTSSNVCEGCPGGCQPEDGMPGLLDIEGMALEMVGGKVLTSAYVEDGDLFFVDVLGKDGNAVEFIADGSTGQIRNFHLLATADVEKLMSAKSADQGEEVSLIDIKAAELVAVKSLMDEFGTEGLVINADSEIFEGYDSYVFEIDGKNGYSYDVYVGLDGHYLGADVYDATEAEDIEAEAAELALKRAYGDESREEMAKEGMALPDGSFPIKDEADLRNAIQAFGRAKDKDKAKAHIIKRAMDLELEDLIPENWVPKNIQEEASGEKDALEVDDPEFMKALMEFEILTAEEDLRNKF